MAIAPLTVTRADSERHQAMIRGSVGEDQQARIAVDIMGDDGHSRSVEAVLDTGFNGSLSLPTDIVQMLGLQSVGQRTFELANGELFEFDVYLAAVAWHEQTTEVLVLRSEGDPLLGMALLWGSRITFDALDGGEVSIEKVEPAAAW